MIPYKEIRSKFPDKFLVLVDYDDVGLSSDSNQFEVMGAESFHVYESINEMYDAYRDLRRQGQKVIICTPDYFDRFVVERRPSMRFLG